jgi:hypothetical protein
MYHLKITRSGPIWNLTLGDQTLGRYLSRQSAEAAATLNAERLRERGLQSSITVLEKPGAAS